jgi:hypothetical protein
LLIINIVEDIVTGRDPFEMEKSYNSEQDIPGLSQNKRKSPSSKAKYSSKVAPTKSRPSVKKRDSKMKKEINQKFSEKDKNLIQKKFVDIEQMLEGKFIYIQTFIIESEEDDVETGRDGENRNLKSINEEDEEEENVLKLQMQKNTKSHKVNSSSKDSYASMSKKKITNRFKTRKIDANIANPRKQSTIQNQNEKRYEFYS